MVADQQNTWDSYVLTPRFYGLPFFHSGKYYTGSIYIRSSVAATYGVSVTGSYGLFGNTFTVPKAITRPNTPSASLQSGGSLPVDTYRIVVSAVNDIGQTIASEYYEIATTSGNQTVQVNWDSVDGATGYHVFAGRLSNGGSEWTNPKGYAKKQNASVIETNSYTWSAWADSGMPCQASTSEWKRCVITGTVPESFMPTGSQESIYVYPIGAYNGTFWLSGAKFEDGRTATPYSNSKNGHLIPCLDDSLNLGSSTSSYKNIYVGSGKIHFGTSEDTNLYRSAANTLKTDDYLQVGNRGINVGVNRDASNSIYIALDNADSPVSGNPTFSIYKKGSPNNDEAYFSSYDGTNTLVYWEADAGASKLKCYQDFMMADDSKAIEWSDVNLYRGGQSILKTDSALVVASTANPGLRIGNGSYGCLTIGDGNIVKNSGQPFVFSSGLSPDGSGSRDLGDTSAEWRNLFIADAGYIYFGNGQDVTLYRSAANSLKTDDNLHVDKNLYVGAGENVSYVYLQSSNDAYIYHSEVGQNSESWLFLESKADSGYPAIVAAFRGAQDGIPEFRLLKGDGTTASGIRLVPRSELMELGSDVNLYRSDANILKTDDTLDIGEHEHFTNSSHLITRQQLSDHLYKLNGATPDEFAWNSIPQYIKFSYSPTASNEDSAFLFCPRLSDGYYEPVLYWNKALAVRKDIIAGGRLDSMEGVVSLLGGVGWGPDGYDSNPFVWLVGNQHGAPNKDTLEIRTSTYDEGWIWNWGNMALGDLTAHGSISIDGDLDITGTFDLNESPLVRIYADGSNAVRIQTPTAAGLIVEQHLWAKDIATDDDITTGSYVNCDGVKVGGTKVVGGQWYPISSLTVTGTAEDGDCRQIVNNILSALRAHGLIATQT